MHQPLEEERRDDNTSWLDSYKRLYESDEKLTRKQRKRRRRQAKKGKQKKASPIKIGKSRRPCPTCEFDVPVRTIRKRKCIACQITHYFESCL